MLDSQISLSGFYLYLHVYIYWAGQPSNAVMLSKDSIPQMLVCALQVPKALISFTTRLDYDLALLIHCQYYFWQKTSKVTGMIMENGADRVEEEMSMILVHARDALCILMQEREPPEKCWAGFAGGNPCVLDAKSEAMAQWVFSHVYYYFNHLAVLVTNVLKEEGSAEMLMMGPGLTFKIEQSTYALLTQLTLETQVRYLVRAYFTYTLLRLAWKHLLSLTYIFRTS